MCYVHHSETLILLGVPWIHHCCNCIDFFCRNLIPAHALEGYIIFPLQLMARMFSVSYATAPNSDCSRYYDNCTLYNNVLEPKGGKMEVLFLSKCRLLSRRAMDPLYSWPSNHSCAWRYSSIAHGLCPAVMDLLPCPEVFLCWCTYNKVLELGSWGSWVHRAGWEKKMKWIVTAVLDWFHDTLWLAFFSKC